MFRLSQVIRVAVLVTLVAIGGVLAWRGLRTEVLPGGFHTYAMFRDASGLPVGSRVMIAGVPVGTIEALSIEGRLARVAMRLGDDVVLWDNAFAAKKASSLLGDSYVEINPGGPDGADPLPDSVEPTSGQRLPHPPPLPGPRRRLRSGERIPHVIEGPSTEALLHSVDRTMPKIDAAFDNLQALVATGRQRVNGDLVVRLEEIDTWLSTTGLSADLADFDTSMGRFEDWSIEAVSGAGGLAPEAARWLDDAATDSDGLRANLTSARAELARRLAEARADLDGLDPYLAEAAEAMGPLADPGSPLSRLATDRELGDAIADTAEAGTSLFGSLGDLQTYVGLRTEYNVLAAQPRFYVTARINTRPGKFYLVELEKGALGGVPELRLSYNPDTATYTRRAVIAEKLRFTVQLGKRIDWLSLRAGVKESSPGVGADAHLWGGRLEVSADVFGNSFDQVPRVKLAAALEVFRTIYILAGVDDALTTGGALPITPYPPEPGVPIQFEELRYGRDYFVGAMLRFDEADLATLLTVYGAALLAVL